MKEILLLFVAGVIIYFIYCIYDENRKKKEDEEQERLKQEKLEKEYLLAERKRECEQWNIKVQSTFNKEEVKEWYKTNRPIKALVGDYSISVAQNTNSVLKSLGIDTEFVPNAHNVIDKINSGNQYDIIITNHVYPHGESGEMVLDTLKEKENFNISIVILTVDQNAREEYVEELGFDEYMEKPLNIKKAKTTLPKVIKDLKFIKIKKQ